MEHFATKADVAALGGRVDGLAATVTGLSGRLDKVDKAIDSKVIGLWQLPGILAACVGICVSGVAAYNYLIAHIGVPH